MAGIWSEESRLARWLEVELAALDGWAEVGAIPADDVAEIRARARPPSVERVAEIERVTDHDTAAFVDAVAEQLGGEGRWFHYGLTSSDVVDTALALQIQDAGRLIGEGIDRAFAAVVARAEEHRHTICIGRSHGVHAEPVTFGWKLVGWAFELDRARGRLARALEANRVGQLSGTVGTYAHVDPEVERIACERLGLEPDPLSTQVIARDRHAELLSTLALTATSLDRFATEIRHLARTEVREVEEPFGRGMKGSSAMPHKRNPKVAERICGLARVVRANALVGLENVPLWHERDISQSSATSTEAMASCSATACSSPSWIRACRATMRIASSRDMRCGRGRRRPSLRSLSAPTRTSRAESISARSSTSTQPYVTSTPCSTAFMPSSKRRNPSMPEATLHVGSGKVRELYALDDERLLLVASDRISTFDVVLPTEIPDKGRVLTGLSGFWFARTHGICANHLIDLRPDGRSTDCRRLEMLPLECVVRGYLAGSGWKDYRKNGTVCGHALPRGLEESAELPEPLFTPSTKATSGHDENIDRNQAAALIGADRLAEVERASIALYRFAADHARARGILIADTKFEFGIDETGTLVLADEVLTPDSSRFWPAEGYRPGGSQPSYDKQFARDYCETLGWDKTAPGPELTEEVVEGTRARYVEAFERLTGLAFGDYLADPAMVLR
jgi:adenylosuccinate lyase/phosphoribosylaminoimidazole-succinocarboxamide synthase